MRNIDNASEKLLNEGMAIEKRLAEGESYLNLTSREQKTLGAYSTLKEVTIVRAIRVALAEQMEAVWKMDLSAYGYNGSLASFITDPEQRNSLSVGTLLKKHGEFKVTFGTK